MGLKPIEIIKEDLGEMVKFADNKKLVLDVGWLIWDKYYREASLKAVKSDDVSWNDQAHKAIDFLLERFLKPKA